MGDHPRLAAAHCTGAEPMGRSHSHSRSPSIDVAALNREARAKEAKAAQNSAELLKQQEEEELKLIEEETALRVEAAIALRVEEQLKSERVQLIISDKVRSAIDEMADSRIEAIRAAEKVVADEKRQKQLEAEQQKDHLRNMMEENKRRVEEAQTKLAADIRRQEEERLVELQELQRQKV